MIQTVTGPLPAAEIHCADAHCHLWIQPPLPGDPFLTDEEAAEAELADFSQAGGDLVLDCQPGDCGRNGDKLSRIAMSVPVAVVASTGFHLARYYPTGSGPWELSEAEAHDLFRRELCEGLVEAPGIRAGSIKTAWTGSGGKEVELMRAALHLARDTDSAIVVHTERGAAVESLVPLVADCGGSPGRIQLSHVDKRPDLALHRDLARTGYLLGYDTFLRPKYDPEHGLWPLLRDMLAEGLWNHITLGLDLVEVGMWHVSGGLGLRAIPTVILPRLREEGATEEMATSLAAGNVCRLLDRGDRGTG